MEAPPARSCAPTSSEGVAGGAWDAPSPQSVPELHSLVPRATAETFGRHDHPELDVTEPSLGPSHRRLLPLRPLPAPASAMAPRMSGRGGAALLCLSALLAHGKCRGADSEVEMRRAPLEGAQGRLEKGEPPPRTRSRCSQPCISGCSSSYLQLPQPFGGSGGCEPRPGDRARPRKRAGGGVHSSALQVRKKGPNPRVWGRVRPRKSAGIQGIR